MMFVAILLMYLMADVMARGHDGDGREDPPPPSGQGRGHHEMDVVPPRRRGKAKNLNLIPLWKKNGRRPLPLSFDGSTFTTVGDIHDVFIRETATYMWQNIPLDRDGWDKVTPAEKNALLEHLRPYFDLDSVMQDANKRKGLEDMLTIRYRGRKSYAKTLFTRAGGYEHMDEARGAVPQGLSEENWNKVIDYFTSEKHMRRSHTNSAVRAKQVIKNRGGTCSYSSACYKKQLTRVEAFRNAHVDKKGTWDNPIVEEQYNALVRELALQTQISASSSNPTPVDEPTVFEKVLGARRGHIKGIGHKPSGNASSSYDSPQQSATSRPPQPNQNWDQVFDDPEFRERIIAVLQSLPSQNNVENAEDDHSGDDDDL